MARNCEQGAKHRRAPVHDRHRPSQGAKVIPAVQPMEDREGPRDDPGERPRARLKARPNASSES
jgi:hypothetical protein